MLYFEIGDDIHKELLGLIELVAVRGVVGREDVVGFLELGGYKSVGLRGLRRYLGLDLSPYLADQCGINFL